MSSRAPSAPVVGDRGCHLLASLGWLVAFVVAAFVINVGAIVFVINVALQPSPALRPMM